MCISRYGRVRIGQDVSIHPSIYDVTWGRAICRTPAIVIVYPDNIYPAIVSLYFVLTSASIMREGMGTNGSV